MSKRYLRRVEMIYGQIKVQTANQELVFSLYDEIPEPDLVGFKVVARYTLPELSDLTLYQSPSGMYIVTLYDTTTEVIWSISDNPLEALETAFRNLLANNVHDIFRVIKGLLSEDEDAKIEAEKMLKDYDELKEAFNKMREEVKAKLYQTA